MSDYKELLKQAEGLSSSELRLIIEDLQKMEKAALKKETALKEEYADLQNGRSHEKKTYLKDHWVRCSWFNCKPTLW